MTWYDPKTKVIKTFDEYYTKEMKMYINYDKEIKDLNPKNQERIEKYKARGFTLIPKPLPVLMKRDHRVFTKEFKIEASDVICLGEVNVCEYLKESKKHIIIKVAQSYYAYNRDELVKELGKFIVRNYTLTPVKQAISINDINIFKYDDYSFYDIKITNVKTTDNKHTLHKVRAMSVKDFENIYNENGIKDGLIKRFYDNGILKSDVNYSDNSRNGIKKKYDIDGNLIQESPYINNKIDGINH
jgi:antitoxin component YwqK of YwqJK toxin-antitoxin module